MQERKLVSSWITPKASNGFESAIAGRGVVALERIQNGEVVAVRSGHVMTLDECRSLSQGRLENNCFQISDDLCLGAVSEEEYESIQTFLNHSCDPNVGIAGNVVIVAMRGIERGEELTLDYATLGNNSDKSMHCCCGAARCRKIVTFRDWRLPELQERYQGYFAFHLTPQLRSG
ncbi:SET domain-containing protein [Bradyrhizobium sp. 4]|uniref:SET domain-containing protein n=1 Tax=unclassified Bradyrhizobium TaxID=2631580 RepID=UPI001FFB5A65|nr:MULTISPECIES: SET domain-containing protein-lysine N-methyltransferase [unclassified Bradyrhizobium]MCK1397059.1 SET domain-containing protein [Bradyrhizobium sp. 39]MCK1633834.1 SET domain-containing protein [Bradyrhizobium sp. 162]MCK1748844.1 SET domain-containing protein [Bradyrhizobium sp. 135]UPJ36451.1 SET domain-containing protein [Bradyrhizobium sp. 4]